MGFGGSELLRIEIRPVDPDEEVSDFFRGFFDVVDDPFPDQMVGRPAVGSHTQTVFIFIEGIFLLEIDGAGPCSGKDVGDFAGKAGVRICGEENLQDIPVVVDIPENIGDPVFHGLFGIAFEDLIDLSCLFPSDVDQNILRQLIITIKGCPVDSRFPAEFTDGQLVDVRTLQTSQQSFLQHSL